MELASDSRSEALIGKMRPDDPPEVKDAWLDKVVDAASCIDCGGKLVKKGSELECKGCGQS